MSFYAAADLHEGRKIQPTQMKCMNKCNQFASSIETILHYYGRGVNEKPQIYNFVVQVAAFLCLEPHTLLLMEDNLARSTFTAPDKSRHDVKADSR